MSVWLFHWVCHYFDANLQEVWEPASHTPITRYIIMYLEYYVNNCSSAAEYNQEVKKEIMRNILDQPNCKFAEETVAGMPVIYLCYMFVISILLKLR